MDNQNTNHETQFEAKIQEKSQKREKVIITASAVFIMAALTLTGVYMNNKSEQDNIIQEDSAGLHGDLSGNVLEVPGIEGMENFQIVDSDTVENPGRTGNAAATTESVSEKQIGEEESASGLKPATKTSNTLKQEGTKSGEVLTEEEVLASTVEAMMLSFNGIQMFAPFTEGCEILIPYSMNKAVYFKTLDQYKYNPAMIVAAEIGAPVCTVSSGKIVDKYWDFETGWTIEMDLGGGFKAYYGQLNNDTLQKDVDTYVAAGDILGYVDVPTKYYAEEGSNIYFAMTRNGQPVNPMDYVGE